MKRMICLLLAALTLLAGLPALAMAGDGKLAAPAEEPLGFQYCFPMGDGILLAGEDALYGWQPGAAELTRYAYDLPELDENETGSVYPFCADEKLYAIRLVAEDDEGETDYGHTALFSLSLDGGAAVGEELDRLDWDDLVIYDEDEARARVPFQVVGDGEVAWVLCVDSAGDFSTVVAKLDIEDVSLEVDDALENIRGVAPYGDGELLLLQHAEYAEENAVLRYDVEEEEAETVGEFTRDAFLPLKGLACDREKGAVYIAMDGEVCPLDVETGEIGAGIADLPNAAGMGFDSACVVNGVYVLCNETVASRALEGRPEVSVRLRVNDPLVSEIVTDAVNRFNETHDDARAVQTSEKEVQEQMVEGLMRQENGIDIYVLDPSMPTYGAVFDRGFLMPLDGSAALTALAERMYPGVRDAITREGKLQALPVYASAYTLGVSEKALAKLGLSPEDVPDSWDEFLDFLPTLAEPLSEHSDMKLMEGVSNLNQLRLTLLGLIFNGYNYYNTANGIEAPFNAEPLRGLLDRLDAVDFEALGYEPAEGDPIEAMMEYALGGDGESLFSFTAGCTPDSYSSSDMRPIQMNLTADMPACMVLDCMMAAVNPYTRYPELALEFMETLGECMPAGLRSALMPDYDEPVRGASAERSLREQRETVAQLEAQLEAASEANRQLAQSALDNARETLETLEQNAWDVSPAGLEWYHAHDDSVMPAGVNWLNSEYGMENVEYLAQYCAGEISGEELLADFDKTSDMMRREGN